MEGLDLLGVLHGGPAAAGDLAADVALAAGERVAAGVDLDLEAVAVLALSDHACCLLAPFLPLLSPDGRSAAPDRNLMARQAVLGLTSLAHGRHLRQGHYWGGLGLPLAATTTSSSPW